MPGFPNVPFAPGVPPLARNPLAVATTVGLLVADAISFFAGFLGPQWGIFQDGLPVVLADNVVSLDYKKDWEIANYPMEQGAFQSYDKVENPFEARVRFSTGGTRIDRQVLLSSITAIAGNTELYDVYTPEAIYPSVNIAHYDYRRTAVSGVGLLTIDVWVHQVRVDVETSFTNTQTAGGANPIAGGQVQGGAGPAIGIRSRTTGQQLSGPSFVQ